MDAQPESGSFLLGVWLFLLTACSLIAWTTSRGKLLPRSTPPHLTLRGLDYGMFLWAVFCSIIVLQLILGALFTGSDSVGNAGAGAVASTGYSTWALVLGSLALQLPLLGVTLLAQGQPGLPFYHTSPECEGVNPWREFGAGIRIFFMVLPILFVVTALWRLLLYGLSLLFPGIPLESQIIVTQIVEDTNWPAIVTLVLIGVILAPIAEELFFRGSLYRFLRTRIGGTNAMMLSGLVFALIHGNLGALFSLWLVGVVLAWIYERRGSLYAPIAFHMAFNAQGFVVIFLSKP